MLAEVIKSPDLSVRDYSVRGALKSKVCLNNPHRLQVLRQNILDKAAAIPTVQLQSISTNLLAWGQKRQDVDGGPFQHLLQSGHYCISIPLFCFFAPWNYVLGANFYFIHPVLEYGNGLNRSEMNISMIFTRDEKLYVAYIVKRPIFSRHTKWDRQVIHL